MDKDKSFWLAFSHVPGVGFVRISRLLDAFGNLERAWNADRAGLRQAGIGPKTIEAILRTRSTLDLERAKGTLQKQGIRLITYLSPDYPEPLKQIQGPPACLFIKGDLLPEDRMSVAVVGTRTPSGYGIGVTERVVAEIAAQGVTIISGLARGVDGIAHRAALEASGRTIAILGSGIDEIYPWEHRRLASSIIERGALLSEYPPGTAPEGHHFPARNRIIAGLALGVIVVEAAERSGALITANFAGEQGKEVFAVPGDVTRKTAGGTNRLIQDGAHPLLSASEAMEILSIDTLYLEKDSSQELPEDDVQRAIYTALKDEPVHIDFLYQQTGFSIQEIQVALSMLELGGSIKHLGGMHYQRIREAAITYRVD